MAAKVAATLVLKNVSQFVIPTATELCSATEEYLRVINLGRVGCLYKVSSQVFLTSFGMTTLANIRIVC